MKRAKELFEREGIIVQAYPVDFRRGKNVINSLCNPILWLPSANSLNESSEPLENYWKDYL